MTAVGSYLDAHLHNGKWLIRMEDIDTPRNAPGAADQILRTLEQFGFEPQGPVLFQSTRLEAYEAALETLRQEGKIFACGCSRKEIGGRYPGTCRTGHPTGEVWRLRTCGETATFEDRWKGLQSQNVEAEIGDFVLKRADGLFAYQLAVVIDDEFQNITDVVRGEDLLDSTPRQILLQRALGFPTPRYLHLPVVVNDLGQKLSKQTGAAPLDITDPGRELRRALEFLGFEPPALPLQDLWGWARANSGSRFGALPPNPRPAVP